MQPESRRDILAFVVLGFTAFLWLCMLSQHPGDALGSTEPVRNACGPLGASVAFRVTLWLGTLGAYGLATGLAIAGLALLFRRKIEQPAWKVVGGVLMLLALSSLEVAWSQGETFPEMVPGGYYGQFFYGLLLSQVSTAGSHLILGLVLLVAFLVSTDTFLYPALSRIGGSVLNAERVEMVVGKIRSGLAGVKLPLPRPRLSWEWAPAAPPIEREEPRKKARGGDGEGSRGASTAVDGERPAPPRGDAPPAASKKTEAPQAKGASNAEDGGETVTSVRPAPVAPTDEKPETRPPLTIREPETRGAATRKRVETRCEASPYKLPPLELLDRPVSTTSTMDRTILEQTAAKIEETLRHFKIEARVVEVQKGPTITQFELALAAGIKVHKIMNLSDDLAMALKAPSIRIVAPIPGKSTVGVEVPNKSRSSVGLRELLDDAAFRAEDFQLPLALGKDVAGSPIIGDLGDMPHLLIAGSTGSGKSVCINSIITTFLVTRTPEEVKLILVDPKMVELAQFENIPHLLAPVVTDMKKAPSVLAWTVDKMEERYELFAMVGVRHITSYNSLGREKLRERLKDKVDEADMDDFPERLPFIVVIIDELADLMMSASKEVETSITRLSQKSRAVGIHVILATQRPSVDVITGLIKANMSSRISFHVASKVDSRTILDRNGAEKLLGKGDMLYLPPGTSALLRVQGTYISDKAIRDVVDYSVRQAKPEFNPELTRFGVDGPDSGSEEDDLYEEAVRIVLGSRRGSVTLLQRQLQIGYTRASRLMELMHEQGLVGPFKGSKAREVYYTIEEWEEARARKKGAEASESSDEPDAEDDLHPDDTDESADE